MLFGEALNGQLPVANSFTYNGIVFVGEIRDFLKERVALEKDYAHRMEQLVKRFTRQKEKLGQSLMGDAVTGSAASPADDQFGTLFKAWTQLLATTEQCAQDRAAFAESVTVEIVDPLKVMATRHDDARKKHLAFAQKMLDERTRAVTDKDRMREKYEQACDQVEAARNRRDKAPDEKTLEKLRNIWQIEVQEMNNTKNNYILSVKQANVVQRKFHTIDMPQILDYMQQLNEDRIASTRSFWEKLLQLEHDLLARNQQLVGSAMTVVHAVAPKADVELFAGNNRIEQAVPHDFVFEPSLLWKDSDALVTDESAKVYLANKVAKAKSTMLEIDADVHAKTKEIEGLQRLLDAYKRSPNAGDPFDVNESVIEAERAVALCSTNKVRMEAVISTVTSIIGGQVEGQQHTLMKAGFAIPTTCDYCLEKIWGLSKQGFTCKDCGYNCHAKCEMKVPPYCQLSKEARLKRVSSIGSRDNLSPTGPSVLGSYSSVGRSSARGSAIIVSSTHAGGSALATSSLSSLPTSPVVSSFEDSKATVATVLYAYEAENEDELSVGENENVRVLTADDGSGWMKVARIVGTEQGLVPVSYISVNEAQVAKSMGPAPKIGSYASATTAMASASLSNTNTPLFKAATASSTNANASQPTKPSKTSSLVPTPKLPRVRAVYDYDAANDQELTIREGDEIEVMRDMDDGWSEGRLLSTGKVGQYPSNYVEPI